VAGESDIEEGQEGEDGSKAGEIRRTLKIRNKLGLHARAAVKFVQLAGQFKSEIKVGRNGQEANGKSIMGLLTLVAAWGVEIEVATIGPDAPAAMEALAALIGRGFDEGAVDA
jgi:phosphocarrier protein HPr